MFFALRMVHDGRWAEHSSDGYYGESYSHLSTTSAGMTKNNAHTIQEK
jgi:hypothetical protein